LKGKIHVETTQFCFCLLIPIWHGTQKIQIYRVAQGVGDFGRAIHAQVLAGGVEIRHSGKATPVYGITIINQCATCLRTATKSQR
jgi:hypothetical protein